MPRLTNKQRAAKVLADAKAREQNTGKPARVIKAGVTGESITGKRHWG